ncbi:MAG TPA: dihydrolipoyllysine-residue acetyltransferase [Gammaproteobacteria bacterium]|nr:dihydrolipoyllysine-residue acetyltransferase [Gammaproteobacteria bacterium]
MSNNTVEIKVPDLGDASDVEIIEVLVSAGDTVEKEGGLITLETDKAAMDVPSSQAGTIKEMKVKTGDKVSQGDVIALLEPGDAGEKETEQSSDEEPAKKAEPEPKEESSEKADKEKDEKEKAPAKAKTTSTAEQIAHAPVQNEGETRPSIDEKDFKLAHASPSVRKFARELGANLGSIKGSGRKGRITESDVKAFVKRVMQSGGQSGGLPQVPTVDFAKFGEVETQALSRIKKIAGPRLQASWLNAPHVTQHDEADITDLETVRRALKSDAKARDVKLTPVAFLIKAAAQALQEFPHFNSSLSSDGESIVLKKYFHIGFAVDTPGGLVVPVIRDADKKDIFEIGAELMDLSQKARDGKLKAADMQGGCFTISSLGSIGGTSFTPIVNAPEVAILGVSRSQEKPVWNGKEFVPRTMLPLSLSYDHRVIDGAAAARFTVYLGQVLSEVRNLVL